MKKIFRNLMMLLCALTALVSCDESGDKIYLDGFKASDLMASASDVKLSVDNSKDVVLSLAWQNPTLFSSDETKPAGSGVLKTYLQASASEDFASVKEYTVTDLSKAFTGADLNAAAKDLGLSPDVSSPLYFRIKSQMGANLDAAYSNVCQVKVTPYLIDMSYINILNEKKEKTYDMSGFAKGADVSWLTEMEKDGVKFYNQNGKATECMKLLREEGTNSIRLRVWVNPEGGWCGKDDVIAKAWRAQQLGFRLMIDFHYSDTWADPGNQKVPAAWQGYTAEQMKQAVADHTKDVLKALKDRGVTNVEWVQVGNETRDGMLWNSDEAVTGQVSKNAANFAAYINAGYDAVKEVYPKAKVIVHVDKGQDLGGLTWLYDKLKDNGGKWDVIGLSLYPEDDNWQSYAESCLSNIQTLSSMYGKDVIISEIGMWWGSDQAAPLMKKMVDGCKKISTCEGIFYWEPEVYNNWKPANYITLGWDAYTKGAFDNSGKPTAVFDAYK